MIPKKCLLCGSTFVPVGRNSKYCGGAGAQYIKGTCAHTARLLRHKQNLYYGYKPKYIRAVIQTGKCAWCGTCEHLSVDHVVPRMIGGNDKKENLRILCRSCNSKRHKILVRKALRYYFDAGFSD